MSPIYLPNPLTKQIWEPLLPHRHILSGHPLLPPSLAPFTPEAPRHHPCLLPSSYVLTAQRGSDPISFQSLPVQTLNPFNERMKPKQEETRGFSDPHLAGRSSDCQLLNLWLTEYQ